MIALLELGTLEDDLLRRDFTLNALAKDLDGTIIDLFEGRKHLKENILITPLDPEKTFMDDPLRMIRALRFSITRGFEIHESLWKEMFKPELLDKLQEVVSQERIQGELTKMLKHDTVKTLRFLQEIDNIEPRLLEIMFEGAMWLMPTNKLK